MEIFARNDLMQEINIMAFLLESVALLTSFLIYGVTLIMDIRKYYEKRYSAQRICVIKQVIAISIAIVVLQIKLAIEYFFCADGFCHGFGTGHFPEVTIWVQLAMILVIVADILPIAALIYSSWIASKC